MAQTASRACEICISASGSHYCLDCEQYFCENCKTFHKRQKVTNNHQFQSSSDIIPEGKSKCKDHNEDLCFLCITCNTAVCSSCVTGNHKRHEFSNLLDSLSQLKEKNKEDLRGKVQEASKNMKNMEEGLKEFNVKLENVIKVITAEGTKIKAMVDKCIAEMIVTVRDHSMREHQKLTKIIAETDLDLKAGSDLDQKLYELDKTRNYEKLLQSLQKITDDIAKLTVKPIPEFPNIKYTAMSATDNDIKQLFGIFKISEVETQKLINREREIPSPISNYEKNVKRKGQYLFMCEMCGHEKSTDRHYPRCCGMCMDRID